MTIGRTDIRSIRKMRPDSGDCKNPAYILFEGIIMDMTEITQIIGNLGFPIFVAVWMLYKSSSDSADMRSAISELKEAIVILTDKLDNDGK